jgi:hypothetical protein
MVCWLMFLVIVDSVMFTNSGDESEKLE